MTTIFRDIESALETRLDSMVGVPAVVRPNQKYCPAHGTSWLRTHLLPVPTEGGTMTTDFHRGIYQVDIFTQAGEGRGTAQDLADSIADHFTIGLELTENSTIVRIISVSVRAARNESDWYNIPIEIRYHSLTTNR